MQIEDVIKYNIGDCLEVKKEDVSYVGFLKEVEIVNNIFIIKLSEWCEKKDDIIVFSRDGTCFTLSELKSISIIQYSVDICRKK